MTAQWSVYRRRDPMDLVTRQTTHYEAPLEDSSYATLVQGYGTLAGELTKDIAAAIKENVQEEPITERAIDEEPEKG